MNNNLTNGVKKYAMSMGANLVGIAPVERFENAPVMMSPKGIMPTATNVIVCAIHHPDGAIELGGEEHPQVIGPYGIQYIMNTKLDYLAYHIAAYLTNNGYDAVPIASSNIWRYRKFMGLEANFAPDISHIYAAVCAGLSQLGWHGLSMTPEYGPWNRFVSVITDAPLAPTPMYDDMKLCDMCGECIKHCPTDAYRKEVNGTAGIVVEGREFKFANKNLWRCAWGEHFDLDLDLEIPDTVNEEVLLDYIKKYGKRGGEMGCCLKYCLPKHLRQPGGDFTSTYIRKKHSVATDLPVHRALYDKIVSIAARYCVDNIAFVDQESLDATGVDYKKHFPNAKGAVIFSMSLKKQNGETGTDKLLLHHGREYTRVYEDSIKKLMGFADLDITLEIENAGYESVCQLPFSFAEDMVFALGFEKNDDEFSAFRIVLATAPFLNKTVWNLQEPSCNPKKTLTENISRLIINEGSHNFAVAKADRFDRLADVLAKLKENEELFVVKDKNTLHMEFDPVVTAVKRKIHKPSDYLEGAKNVIIFGLHFPDIVAKTALKPPAYAVGPYVFATYETLYELEYSGLKICKYLQGLGYGAAMTHDLTGIGTSIGSPRGLLHDSIGNSLEAVEAGIGELALNGNCYTKSHGFNQRFMAIITDAPLDEMVYGEDGGKSAAAGCADCKKCIKACPAGALTEESMIEIELADKSYKWIPFDSKRCEWAKKHSLCAEEGIKYTGSLTDATVPDEINAENLAAALKKVDPVLKNRPTIAERCIIDCPLVNW